MEKRRKAVDEIGIRVVFTVMTIGCVLILLSVITPGSISRHLEIVGILVGGIGLPVSLIAVYIIDHISEYCQFKAMDRIMSDPKWIVGGDYYDGQHSRYVALYDRKTGYEYGLSGDGWFSARVSKVGNRKINVEKYLA